MTWQPTRLKYLAATPITNGLGEAAQQGDAEWPRYIRTTDIANPRRLHDDRKVTLPPEVARRALVQPDDLLMCAAGSLGKVYLHSGGEPACYAGYLVRFRPQQDLVDPRFIAYWAESQPFSDQIAVGAVRSTIDNFSAGKYQQMELSIPALEDQRRIADFLDAETVRIDRLNILRQRQRDLLLERRAGALERLWLPLATMARGNPLDVPRAEDVPPQWDIKPLSELLQRITYGFTNPMPDSDHGPYLLTANDIGNGSVLYETARRTTESAFRSLLTDKSRPIRGDVLVTKDGSLGRVAEADGTRSCINQSVALLRPKSEYLDGSLVEALQVRAYNDALVFNAGGTTIKHLYITRMTKQKVALPKTPRLARNLCNVPAMSENASTMRLMPFRALKTCWLNDASP